MSCFNILLIPSEFCHAKERAPNTEGSKNINIVFRAGEPHNIIFDSGSGIFFQATPALDFFPQAALAPTSASALTFGQV